MVIDLCVVQFWSEIILVLSNRTCAACSFNLLHSVQFTPLSSITIVKHSPNKSNIQRLTVSAVVQFDSKLGVNL